MPEGPEIHLVADKLAKAIAGRRAERVRFGLERLEPYEGELTGRRILGVEAHGKALLTRFEGDRTLYSHNQLYGRWYVCKPGRPPKTGRSLRVAIETADQWALLYSASEIEVLHADEVPYHPFLASLGPDLLHKKTTPALIRKRLRSRRFERRALGSLLLDQHFLAGVGNYLRSEILFFSGLRPDARPKDLSDDEIQRLAATARTITKRSYRTRGVTEEADYAAQAKREGEPRRHWRHAVFARDGHPCRRCEASVRRVTSAGRRLYFCSVCQPELATRP